MGVGGPALRIVRNTTFNMHALSQMRLSYTHIALWLVSGNEIKLSIYTIPQELLTRVQFSKANHQDIISSAKPARHTTSACTEEMAANLGTYYRSYSCLYSYVIPPQQRINQNQIVHNFIDMQQWHSSHWNETLDRKVQTPSSSGCIART